MEDANTKVLLHFDGADGSTTFTDSAPPNRIWTPHGNAQIDTAQSKFGGASGYFDGTGDYIDTPDSEDFNLGSGDFTIDFWMRKNATGLQFICAQCDNSGSGASTSIAVLFAGTNVVIGRVYSGSTQYNAISSVTITDTNWHHVAFVKTDNTGTIYVDGTASGTVDLTGITVNNSSNKFTVGRMGEFAMSYFNGWIDEFRFVKGVAKWTSNFTPPTAPYSCGWAGKIFGVTPAKIFGVVPKKVCGI